MRRLVSFVTKHIRQTCYLAVTILSFLIAFMQQDVMADTYEYDDLNRVTKVSYDDGSVVTYTYDKNGNIKQEKYQKKQESGNSGTTGGTSSDGQNGQKPQNGQTQSGQGQSNIPPLKKPVVKKPSKKKHKAGMKATGKNAIYKIISVKKKTVSFYKFTNKQKTSYTVPNTVKIDGIKYTITKIDAKAFKNNKKLKTLTIGKNITSIGKQAFYGCKKLKTIKIKTTKLTSVGENACKGIYKKAKIKVPKKKYKKYKKLFKGKGQKKTVKISKG
ncbi:MAG: leucine-rich repeat protein [Lachnospiraceae bacterium]|nr:leucine-rich repeat protein [Lachnospiraceae bacterium]